MNPSCPYWRPSVAHVLLVLLALPMMGASPSYAQQQSPSGAPPAVTHNDTPQSGTTVQAAQPGGVPSSEPKTQQRAPVGTAAAPYEDRLGVPASRPAGAAIAPAKQRRARSLTIKVGLIAAAAVAVGITVGLSASSSSRPH